MPYDSHWPLAYLITFRCYGTWLHGDDRGSVDLQHNQPGTPLVPANATRLRSARERMVAEAINLSAAQRRTVEAAIGEVCRHECWQLLSVNARSNHVHAVVGAQAGGKLVVAQLKKWATRRLRDQGHFQEHGPWVRGGSARCLWTEVSIERACAYVLEAQDSDRYDPP